MKDMIMLFNYATVVLVVLAIYNFGIGLASAQTSNTTAGNLTGSTSTSNMTGKNDTSCKMGAQMLSVCNASPPPLTK